MASSDENIGGPYQDTSKNYVVDEEKNNYEVGRRRSSIIGSVRDTSDQTHRTLKSRHIQLIGIGGTIGTSLFVQIGRGLMNGGPGSLFLAFTIWYVADHYFETVDCFDLMKSESLMLSGVLSSSP